MSWSILLSKIVIGDMKGGDANAGIKNIPRLIEMENDQRLRSDPEVKADVKRRQVPSVRTPSISNQG